MAEKTTPVLFPYTKQFPFCLFIHLFLYNMGKERGKILELNFTIKVSTSKITKTKRNWTPCQIFNGFSKNSIYLHGLFFTDISTRDESHPSAKYHPNTSEANRRTHKTHLHGSFLTVTLTPSPSIRINSHLSWWNTIHLPSNVRYWSWPYAAHSYSGDGSIIPSAIHSRAPLHFLDWKTQRHATVTEL